MIKQKAASPGLFYFGQVQLQLLTLVLLPDHLQTLPAKNPFDIPRGVYDIMNQSVVLVQMDSCCPYFPLTRAWDVRVQLLKPLETWSVCLSSILLSHTLFKTYPPWRVSADIVIIEKIQGQFRTLHFYVLSQNYAVILSSFEYQSIILA